MHRFVANMVTGCPTASELLQLESATPRTAKPKQGHQYGSLLARSASLFSTFVQAEQISRGTAVTVNPSPGTSYFRRRRRIPFHRHPAASRHINPDMKTLPPAATWELPALLWPGQQLLIHCAILQAFGFGVSWKLLGLWHSGRWGNSGLLDFTWCENSGPLVPWRVGYVIWHGHTNTLQW